MTEEFIQQMKERLLTERAEVEKKIAEIKKPEAEMDNPDVDDIAQDAADDFLEESLLKVHKDVLERLDAALARIAAGTYGICLACGSPISEAELEAEPWAEHCGICMAVRE